MIEFLPYLLILVGWDGAAPAESMAIAHSLHPTEEACVDKGREVVANKPAITDPAGKEHYRYFCIPAPTASEYEAVFELVK